MYKFLLSLVAMFILSITPVFANDDIFQFDLGKFKVTAIKIQTMNHNKTLFRYKDTKKLEEFLNQKDSTLSAINIFYIDTGNHKILFDTGIDAKVLLEKLNTINVGPKDVDVICITHMHYDHIAGLINDFNRTFPKTDIYIAQEEVDENKTSDLLLAYPNRIKIFKQNEKIFSFIQTIPAFGHTLGHTMFEVTSEGQNLLVWGDIIHAPIQFKEPNIYMTYDTDPIQALSARKKILQKYADSKEIIAGAHLLNCGIGKIKKDKDGYIFEFLKK